MAGNFVIEIWQRSDVEAVKNYRKDRNKFKEKTYKLLTELIIFSHQEL